MVAQDGDFNPAFQWDLAALQPAQSAWEFSGALRQAKKDLAEVTKHKTTTIDEKIRSRLDEKASKPQKGGKQQQGAGRKGAAQQHHQHQAQNGRPKGRQQQSDDDDDEEEEEEEDIDVSEGDDDDDMEDDSEEEALPGELDDEDETEGLDGGDDEDDEGEEEDGFGGMNGIDNGDEDEEEEDGGAGGSEEDGGEEEEEELQQPPSKRQKQEPAKQPQQQQANQKQQQRQQQQEQKQQQQGKQQQGKQEQQNGKQQGKQGQQQQQQQQQEDGPADKAPQQSKSKDGFFARTPEGTTFRAASFADLSLSRPLLRAIEALGYTTPTPIQAAVIPLALAGRDICGSAVTGSGKTAAFTLPVLERLVHRPRQIAATYVLILAPTRELAVQVHSMVTKLAQYTDISAALVVGGLSSSVQAAVLRRSPEIVVATPGRLIDHLRNTQSVGLEDLAVLILDEADRLLEMGFQDEITEILRMAPKKRQTMLFSATFNDEVKRLITLSLKQPVRLAADAAAATPKDLRQEIVRLKGAAAAQKEAMLLSLCSRSLKAGRTIVFFKTKQRAHRAKILFGLLGLPPAAELHGDMTQAGRLESLEAFRTGTAAYLLATDVAARGLDIQGVQVVVNYDAPRTLETHLHRIGRTARAGASGLAVTFVEDGDRSLLKEVIKKTGVQVHQRLVPPQAVEQWQAKIEGAAEDVARVIAEEREERELRKAEMEAAKAQNIIDHEAEIKARPPRTWFQSEKQKREVRKRSADEAAGRLDSEDGGDDDDEEGGGRGSKADKRKAKQEAKNEKRARKKQEAAEAAAAGKGKRRDVLAEETGEFTRAIRSAKSKLRALQEQGIPAAKAAKIAAAQAAGMTGKKKKKSPGKSKGKDGGGGDGLFSGDGRDNKAAGGGSSGEKSDKKGRYLRDRSGLDKTTLNKIKRGGAGKRSFKSKAKFKRRKK